MAKRVFIERALGFAGELPAAARLAGSSIMLGIKSERLAGMASMLMGVASFALHGRGTEAAVDPTTLSFQVAALRGLAALPVVFTWAMYAGGPRQLVRIRWPLHLIRGVLSVFMMGNVHLREFRNFRWLKPTRCFSLPPLLIAIFSTFMLGERVIRAQWVAIVIGFAGVLFVRPPEIAGWGRDPLQYWGVRCATRFRQFS